MTRELVNTLLVLGAAQGVFLAVVLATKQTNQAANKVLAVAMLAFSLYLTQSVYYAREYYRAFPYFIGFSQPLIYLFGPILYVYAQTVSAGGHSFRKKALLHFLPFAAVVLYFIPFFVLDGAAKLAFLDKLRREGPALDLAIIQNLQYVHGITYVVLTIVLLRRHRARLRETHSYVEHINLLWLRNLTIGIVAVWGVATGLYVLEIAGLEVAQAESMLTPLAVSLLVYAVGYLGLKQPEIFHRPAEHAHAAHVAEVASPAGQTEPATVLANAAPEQLHSSAREIPADENGGFGYERSGLTQTQAEAHLQQLLRLMNDKQLYKNSLLTLQDLADEMSISPHHLSQVINAQVGKNFYDFVNGYRIEEVKQRLRDPKAQHLTILALALEAGFNTKSSFNAFFKKCTGVTPSQYRMQDREAA